MKGPQEFKNNKTGKIVNKSKINVIFTTTMYYVSVRMIDLSPVALRSKTVTLYKASGPDCDAELVEM